MSYSRQVEAHTLPRLCVDTLTRRAPNGSNIDLMPGLFKTADGVAQVTREQDEHQLFELRFVNAKMHDLVMGSPAFPSVRDIPLAMMGYDVDYLTVEAFDVGGRNFDTTLVGLYYFAIREDDGVLRAADHIIACGEALRQLVQTRRLAEGMGRAI